MGGGGGNMTVYVDNIGNVYRGGNEGQRYGYGLTTVSEGVMSERR